MESLFSIDEDIDFSDDDLLFNESENHALLSETNSTEADANKLSNNLFVTKQSTSINCLTNKEVAEMFNFSDDEDFFNDGSLMRDNQNSFSVKQNCNNISPTPQINKQNNSMIREQVKKLNALINHYDDKPCCSKSLPPNILSTPQNTGDTPIRKFKFNRKILKMADTNQGNTPLKEINQNHLLDREKDLQECKQPCNKIINNNNNTPILNQNKQQQTYNNVNKQSYSETNSKLQEICNGSHKILIGNATLKGGLYRTPVFEGAHKTPNHQVLDKTPIKEIRDSIKEVPPKTPNNNIFNSSIQCDSTKKRKRLSIERKFPGPAGALPTPDNFKKLKSPKIFETKNLILSPTFNDHLPDLNPLSQDDDFTTPHWQELKKNVSQLSDQIQFDNISKVLKSSSHKKLENGKVSGLYGMIKHISFYSTTGHLVLKDPTGEIIGTVHRKVIEEYEKLLKQGTGLILKNLSVYSPTPKKHYLNITPSNIVLVLPIS